MYECGLWQEGSYQLPPTYMGIEFQSSKQKLNWLKKKENLFHQAEEIVIASEEDM